MHGLDSGQKPGQAKPNVMACRWLWPGSRSQKPKPSQQDSNEYSGGNLQIVYKYIIVACISTS